MSYYNPKIYNYANLHREDQLTVDVMNWAIDAVENMEIDYRPTEDSSIMEKMCDEIALEVVAEVEEQLMHEIIEFIVMTIDSYDHDVDEIDTTDFLFGMEGHRNNDE